MRRNPEHKREYLVVFYKVQTQLEHKVQSSVMPWILRSLHGLWLLSTGQKIYQLVFSVSTSEDSRDFIFSHIREWKNPLLILIFVRKMTIIINIPTFWIFPKEKDICISFILKCAFQLIAKSFPANWNLYLHLFRHLDYSLFNQQWLHNAYC